MYMYVHVHVVCIVWFVGVRVLSSFIFCLLASVLYMYICISMYIYTPSIHVSVNGGIRR